MDPRTGRPRKLVRTTVLAIVLLVWGGLSLLGMAMQVLNLTLLADMQKQANTALRQQLQKQQAVARRQRDSEIAELEAQLADAQDTGDAAGARQVQQELAALKAKPLPTANSPLAGQLKLQELMQGPEMRRWQTVGLLAGLVSTALMIAAGIGLLLRRRWGRLLGIGTGGLAIASTMVGVLTTLWMLEEMGGWDGVASSPAGMGMLAGFCGSIGCGLAVPVAMLVVLFTRGVREEFHAWSIYRGR